MIQLTDKVIIIEQSMQIPLLLMIMLIGFTIKVNVPRDGGIAGMRHPLRMLSLALTCNLVYLCTLLLPHAIRANAFEPFYTLSVGICNSLCTCFLYITALLWEYSRRSRRLYPLIKEGVAFYAACALSALAFWNFMSMSGSPGRANAWLTYVIDTGAYCWVGLLLWTEKSILQTHSHNTSPTRLMAGGFLGWGTLQLLAPAAMALGLTEARTQIVAFGISTILKASILYGLVTFYNRANLQALQMQKNQANDLYLRLDGLRILQAKINAVSQSESLLELSTTIVRHLIDGQLFEFDYAILSGVDYLQEKIFYIRSDERPESHHKNISQRLAGRSVPIGHHDIMAVAVRETAVVRVNGDRVNGEKVNFDDPACVLDKEIFQQFGHQHFDRYFIPVLQRGTGQEIELPDLRDVAAVDRRVVALLEVGYEQNRAERGYSSIDNVGLLNLYIDNVAQTYRRIQENSLEAHIDRVQTDCDMNTEDDCKEYLMQIMHQLCALIKVKKAAFVIMPYDSLATADEALMCTMGIEESDLAASRKSLFARTRDMAGEDGQAKAHAAVLLEMAALLRAGDCKAIAVQHADRMVGSLYLFSEEKDFLNQDRCGVAERMLKPVARTFIEKRFHHAVSGLVVPDNALTDPEENMRPVIQALRKYFMTSYISVWLKGQQDDQPDHFVYKYATNEIRQEWKDYGREPLTLEAEAQITEYVCLDRSPVYMIHVPLQSGDQRLGFIHLYFANRHAGLFSEDVQFLRVIANKCAITIQLQLVIFSFLEIAASFKLGNLDSTLQVITKKAMEFLGADPVILFKSENGKDVIYRDVTWSHREEFYDPGLQKIFGRSEDHVGLAEIILSDESQYFSSDKEYQRYRTRKRPTYANRHFDAEFWPREGIQSLAAIRLVSKIGSKQPVGVLFVNFRRPVIFTEDTKRIIHTFASFAAGVIDTAFKFELNRRLLVKKMQMSEAAMNDTLAGQMLHDAKRAFKNLSSRYLMLMNELSASERNIDYKSIGAHLAKMKSNIIKLDENFTDFERYYKGEVSLELKESDISVLIEKELDELEPALREKLITVKKEYPKDIRIICDEVLVKKVLQNLLANACHALYKRGTLEVRMQRKGSENIRIDVIDDGIGINNDLYDLITVPYVTDKEGGTGLGLATCRLAVEKHKGSFRYSSSNKRTVFTVELPVTQKVEEEQ